MVAPPLSQEGQRPRSAAQPIMLGFLRRLQVACCSPVAGPDRCDRAALPKDDGGHPPSEAGAVRFLIERSRREEDQPSCDLRTRQGVGRTPDSETRRAIGGAGVFEIAIDKDQLFMTRQLHRGPALFEWGVARRYASAGPALSSECNERLHR
jgi:hypothetical protein